MLLAPMPRHVMHLFVTINHFPALSHPLSPLRASQVIETFSLSYNSLKQAVDAVVDAFGMQPCDNSASATAGAQKHTLLLSGVFLGGVQAFAIVNLRADNPKAVGMRLTVRSTDMEVSQFVGSSVA